MSAEEACDVVESSKPEWECIKRPLTDGGEGFCQILTSISGGTIKEIEVKGPGSENVMAKVGFVSISKIPETAIQLLKLPAGVEKIAIIEMAQASGIQSLKLEERNPWYTTTYGTGQMLDYAKKQGAQAIVLGLGGSATSDLGLGALQALGLDVDWRTLHQDHPIIVPSLWSQIKGFKGEISSLPPLRIACDVDNPLCGARGAARVFGPQKGLAADDIDLFDGLAETISHKLLDFLAAPLKLPKVPGCGAAGGIGFGLKAAYDADFIPGFNLVQSWLDLENQVRESDLIITGEGCFDESSLGGKGPYSLIEMANKHRKKVILLAGKVDSHLNSYFQEKNWDVELYGITPEGIPLEKALKEGKEFLEKTIKQINPQLSRKG